MKFVTRLQHGVSSYLTLILVGFSIYYISISETTLINWIFFTLNILNLCALSNNDGKEATLKHSLRVAVCIVGYSTFIVLGECTFAYYFGMKSHALVGSRDAWLKDNFPVIYDALQLIGLRRYIKPGEIDD